STWWSSAARRTATGGSWAATTRRPSRSTSGDEEGAISRLMADSSAQYARLRGRGHRRWAGRADRRPVLGALRALDAGARVDRPGWAPGEHREDRGLPRLSGRDSRL